MTHREGAREVGFKTLLLVASELGRRVHAYVQIVTQFFCVPTAVCLIRKRSTRL